MAERTFTVANLDCAGCEDAVQVGMGRLAGVEGVTADHQQGTVTVTFDPARVAPAALQERLATLGFAPAQA